MTVYVKHTATATLLLLSGCCPGIDFSGTPLHFDERFTEVELTQLYSAVAEWSIALDRPMPELVTGEPHGWSLQSWADDRSVIHRMEESEATVLRQFWSPRFVGLASPGGSIVIAIERIRDLYTLRHVMLHECGHVYSCLGHEEGTLMAGSVSSDKNCIDATTLEEACDVQPSGCGPNAGSTCAAEDP